MRIFELLLLVLLVPPTAELLLLARPKQLWALVSWVFAPIAFLLHVVYERLHWQMFAAYLTLTILGVSLFFVPRKGCVSRLAGLVCLLLLITSAGASWVLPMFHLPSPTGRYPVGTTILYMVDKSRVEIHARPPQGPRELMVQIWYPAENTQAPLAPYRRRVETTMLSSYMAILMTHSRIDVPVAHPAGLFPVLLFSPAWKSPRTESTYLMEDLASHGFVIVSIDYPYVSEPVAFPDGRIIVSTDTRDIDNFTDYTVDNALAYANAEADYQAQDSSFVLDQLEIMNFQTGNRFFVALDTNHVGAFGHSFGGGVAMQTALRDSRVKGAINYDGWTFGDVGKVGLPKPFMMMYEPYPAPSTAELNSVDPTTKRSAQVDSQDQSNIQRALTTHGGYRLTIPTARHMNFADRSLYSPLRDRTDSGIISPEYAHEIIRTYTLAFFSKLLKGQPQPILETVPALNPDIKYEVFPQH